MAARVRWYAFTAAAGVTDLSVAEADSATTADLLGLHVAAAMAMIPALARSLRARTDP